MQYFGLVLLLFLADTSASPYLWHINRFPPAPIGIIKANLQFNRSYQEWVRKRLDLNRDDQWAIETLNESEMLWKAYDLLDDARNEMFSVYRRRKALGELLNIIGPESFFRGEMPCHIPLWRFCEVR